MFQKLLDGTLEGLFINPDRQEIISPQAFFFSPHNFLRGFISLFPAWGLLGLFPLAFTSLVAPCIIMPNEQLQVFGKECTRWLFLQGHSFPCFQPHHCAVFAFNSGLFWGTTLLASLLLQKALTVVWRDQPELALDCFIVCISRN